MSISKFIRAAAVAALALIWGFGEAAAQGVTTAAVSGIVRNTAGETLSGVQISLQNAATGVQTGALTNAEGRYFLPNLRPGGPYVVTATIIGYETQRRESITLGLGENQRIDFILSEEALEIEGIDVVADRVRRTSGIQTIVDETTIANTPTINREIVDVARLTPQAFVSNEDDDGAAISIAGQNAEYNSLYIDGVVNNDVFGLSAQGTNGGQTGAPPISFDAIEQFQIAISPYDVTQGGFTGGAINAITRSGTNEFRGSFYYQLRNESLAGESVWRSNPQPLPEFSTNRYGFRLGGPILEDKLFFFVNAEIFRSETPAPFTGGYEGDTSLQGLEALRQQVLNVTGYDPGSFRDKVSSLDDDKLLAKIDWNINQDHRLALRHSYSQSDNLDAFQSDANEINYSNNAEVFPNETNSTALEINSSFGDGQYSNRFLFGMTFVRDDRGFASDPFPAVTIEDGRNGEINFGSERFSTGNILNQDIYSITNNFNIYRGDHTITVGTHNEFYDIGNLFLRENFGYYEYRSVDDFLAALEGNPNPNGLDAFSRGYSLVDNVVGDASNAIGAFKAYQLGFYVQDEWRYSDRLTLSGGLRVDIPKVTTDPRTNPEIVNQVFPQIAQIRDLEGAEPGKTPDAALYFAPRLGFSYDLDEDGINQLRGGVGVFTGRVPFVYPGAMYLNNGVTAGYISDEIRLPNGDPVPFRYRTENFLTGEDFGGAPIPAGEVDVFTEDFRYPRVFRTSLGADYMLPGEYLLTLEGQYTKTLDNITVERIDLRLPNDNLDGPDNRPVYNYGAAPFGGDLGVGLNPFGASTLDLPVGPVLKVGSTNDGYTYDITAAVSKRFGDNTSVRLSYSYGDAYAANDATSDQIWSVWRFNENVNGLNNIGEARSDWSLGHRLLATFNHRQEFLENLATEINVIFSGEQGRPFSFIIGNNFTFTGEGSGTSPLAYIPARDEQLLFIDFEDRDGNVITAEQQRQAFNDFVDGNDYLSSRRGEYAERNGDRAPMEWVMDLSISQEVFGNVMGRRNTVELTLDIFNFTNLLNDDWGRRYNAGFRTVDLLEFEGYRDAANGDLTPGYTFQLDDENMEEYWNDRILDFGNYGSRWLMQFGARYTF